MEIIALSGLQRAAQEVFALRQGRRIFIIGQRSLQKCLRAADCLQGRQLCAIATCCKFVQIRGERLLFLVGKRQIPLLYERAVAALLRQVALLFGRLRRLQLPDPLRRLLRRGVDGLVGQVIRIAGFGEERRFLKGKQPQRVREAPGSG